MSSQGRSTPQLIEAIHALLNAIGKEDDQSAEIEKAKTILASLGSHGSHPTKGATGIQGDVPRKPIEKEPGEGSGGVKPGLPGLRK